MLVNPSDIVAKAKATIKECSVTDVHDCLGADTIFIDIREPAEYQRGHIPGAVLLPRGLLEFELHGLVDKCRKDVNLPPEETPIVLYCGTGGRSTLAALSAEELGYKNVKSMAGGIVAWAQAQLPVDYP
ncbi:MAG: rhodanese-like domain-containing protein [Woeseiaceae bacterium]|jgi:rhodanese-related sulfurtransferase